MQFENVLAGYQDTRQRKEHWSMDRKLIQLGFCIVALATSAAAQTTVTNNNNGTTDTVPVYTGTATLGNSPISVSGSNVGIGTTTPGALLNVGSYNNSSAAYGMVPALFVSTPTPHTVPTFEVRFVSQNPDCSGCTNIAAKLTNNDNTGTSKTNYALWIDSNSAANNFAIYANSGQSFFADSVGIGTTSPQYPLDVAGQIRSSGGIVFPDGSIQSVAYAGCTGGDYAESVDVTGDRKKFEPGDILVIDPDHPGKFLKSAEPYSTSVTGIYSTKPGTVGRRQTTPKSPDEVPMAMLGIVPTRVSAENGPIKPGDLLVTSSRIGYAMKGTDRSRMLGAVVGKALGSLDSGTGVIEVVVTLQ